MGMHAVAKTQQTSPGRGVWPASQKLLTHSKKVRGTLHQRFVGRFFFYLLIGSQKWMLWENICGRGCSELSCTAWTDGLGLRVEGGLCGVEGGCGAAAEAGHRQKRRRGFKKSRAWGLVGGVVLFFSFSLPFSSAPACFLGEDAAICWRWCDECRQGTGSTACLF